VRRLNLFFVSDPTAKAVRGIRVLREAVVVGTLDPSNEAELMGC
jgi:hypothetical protein